ncbi:hypothetical protein EOL70_15890 [Leucothrix sargassi]|nr:hypothetical protein EOL70_15890 [Leucothrix sargassi]
MKIRKHCLFVLLLVSYSQVISREYYDSEEYAERNIKADDLISPYIITQPVSGIVCVKATYVAFKYIESLGNHKLGENPLSGYSHLSCKSSGNESAQVQLRTKEVACSSEEHKVLSAKPNLWLIIDVKNSIVKVELNSGKEINWELNYD